MGTCVAYTAIARAAHKFMIIRHSFRKYRRFSVECAPHKFIIIMAGLNMSASSISLRMGLRPWYFYDAPPAYTWLFKP